MIGKADTVGRLSEADLDATLARLEALARVMDTAFVLPGSNVRLGLDAVLGLVPVIGDLISQAIGSYLIFEARRLGVSRLTLWRMVGNSAIDTVIGAVPLAGDAFDLAFRSNTRNLALLRTHLERQGYRSVRGRGSPAGYAMGSGPVIEGTATRIS
ncbi:MAG: DUF4112 domain-containing protein [Hyphomicrobium sp.]